MTAMDMILVILIGGFLLGRGGTTKKCDSALFWAGMSFLMYGGFFIVRNIIICLSCYWTKNPKLYSLIGRGIGWFIDWILLTILVIYATTAIKSEHSIECKDSEPIIEQWYMITLICVIATYIYLALLWFIFPAIMIIFTVAVCYFRGMQ